MAQATVTLKITPNELQVIAEALRMYAFVNHRLGREQSLLKEYRHNLAIGNGDSRRLKMVADKIRQDIGLKS